MKNAAWVGSTCRHAQSHTFDKIGNLATRNLIKRQGGAGQQVGNHETQPTPSSRIMEYPAGVVRIQGIDGREIAFRQWAVVRGQWSGNCGGTDDG